MVCLYCSGETRVANSRHQKRLNQVWRRRQCLSCKAVFSTLEMADTTQALRIANHKRLEPFSRDTLLLSLYDSLRHRKTAISDATALVGTIMGLMYPLVEQATIQRDVLVELAGATLERFDPVAATHYRAFHV